MRELSQVTPFELVLLIVMSDLIQQGVTHNDFSLTGATLAIGAIAFWAIALSWITYLSPRAQRMLEGVPRVLIQHGRLIEANMRRDRITRAELEIETRLSGIRHMADVEWGSWNPMARSASYVVRTRICRASRMTRRLFECLRNDWKWLIDGEIDHPINMKQQEGTDPKMPS